MNTAASISVPNALTVDVEDYFHVTALAPSIHRDSWNSRESRVVVNTQRLLGIFEQFDVRATFFVLGWVAERYPQLVKDIAARGHEIAGKSRATRKIERDAIASRRDRDVWRRATG